jgi:A/G-specific adenine glycosylase
MELGATVCTPAAPDCDACPVAQSCAARELGATDRIPPAKTKAKQRTVFHASIVVRGSGGRVLLEQRPSTGLWARLWQVPTLERDDRPPTAEELRRAAGLVRIRPIGAFTHVTTHRLVRIDVWEGALRRGTTPVRGIWFAPSEIESKGISNAQKRVLALGSAARTNDRAQPITPPA